MGQLGMDPGEFQGKISGFRCLIWVFPAFSKGWEGMWHSQDGDKVGSDTGWIQWPQRAFPASIILRLWDFPPPVQDLWSNFMPWWSWRNRNDSWEFLDPSDIIPHPLREWEWCHSKKLEKLFLFPGKKTREIKPRFSAPNQPGFPKNQKDNGSDTWKSLWRTQGEGVGVYLEMTPIPKGEFQWIPHVLGSPKAHWDFRVIMG